MEELLPDQLAPMIEKRLTGLKSLLAIKKKACEKAPRGRIRISQNGGHPEYYLVTERGSLRGKYLPHSQEELARRALITPVTLTDEQYAARWQEVFWTGRSFAPDAPLLYTANKERVRSKSEIIIADTLFRYNVPYRYEFPLTLRRSNTAATGNTATSGHHTSITLYPDFLCLNTRTRQEFFWEHFGLMDEPVYSTNAAGKRISKIAKKKT